MFLLVEKRREDLLCDVPPYRARAGDAEGQVEEEKKAHDDGIGSQNPVRKAIRHRSSVI